MENNWRKVLAWQRQVDITEGQDHPDLVNLVTQVQYLFNKAGMIDVDNSEIKMNCLEYLNGTLIELDESGLLEVVSNGLHHLAVAIHEWMTEGPINE